MLKKSHYTGAIFALLVFLSACHPVEPVYNVTNAPVQFRSTNAISSEQVGALIVAAAQSQGWIVAQPQPGVLSCSYSWKAHSASVVIRYSSVAYSIELLSSQNLREEDGSIHRRYNSLVRTLKKSIDRRLSQQA